MWKKNYHNHVSGKTIDEYIPAEDYFEKGLYTFGIGQNDLTLAVYSLDLDQILSLIPTILLEFETGLKVGDNV
jgi:kinesin family protein 5